MPNIKDVAKLAGLSVGTVSRVLNNRGYISDETRAKVNDATRQLHYVPNELAKSIFRHYTRMIGVIVPAISHPYFGKIVEAIERNTSRAGYKMMLCNSYNDSAKEAEYFRLLRSNQVDGIILASRNVELGTAPAGGLPLVTIDRILAEDIPCVSSDNYQGGVLATQHLITRGCRHPALIGGTPSLHLMANLRSEGFVDTCRKNGIEPVIIPTEEADFATMDYEAKIGQLLAEHPKTDGVFASSDIIAAQVIQVFQKRGRHIPQDVKVVGFDDISISKLVTPRVTTVSQPIDLICRYAVDFIIKALSGEIVPLRTVLPVALVEREST